MVDDLRFKATVLANAVKRALDELDLAKHAAEAYGIHDDKLDEAIAAVNKALSHYEGLRNNAK